MPVWLAEQLERKLVSDLERIRDVVDGDPNEHITIQKHHVEEAGVTQCEFVPPKKRPFTRFPWRHV